MIDIAELENITIDNLLTLIHNENNELIEIALPKSSQQYFSEPAALALDYAFAAYSAQELSNAGIIVKHDLPEPSQFQSYLFTVQIADKQLLAEVIYKLACLYGFTEYDDYEEGQGLEDVNQFIYEIDNNKIIPLFPQLIDVFKEYYPSSKQNEEEK
jgi:hypothetical protein